jgi:hypothetical protein
MGSVGSSILASVVDAEDYQTSLVDSSNNTLLFDVVHRPIL